MEKRQRFSAEFKREAIRMMHASGKPASDMFSLYRSRHSD